MSFYGDSALKWQNRMHCHHDPHQNPRTAPSARDAGGTGDDVLGAVIISGHGTDADAGDYLNTDS